MDMGRRAELARKHTSLIRISLTQVCSESRSALEAHLDVADSTGSATGRPSNRPVPHLLIVDETDPKSQNLPVFQLIARVEHLSGQSDRCFASPEDRLSLEMLTTARLLDLTGLRCCKGSAQTNSFAAFLDLMDTCLEDFAHAAISCLRSLRLPLSTSICQFLFLFRPESVPGITLAFDRRCCYEEGIYTDINHPRRTPCETSIYLLFYFC